MSDVLVIIRTIYKSSVDDEYVYGWTDSKSMYKVFKDQRDKKKYKYLLMDEDEAKKMTQLSNANKLALIKVRSIKNKNDYIMCMTTHEERSVNAGVNKLLEDASAMSNFGEENVIRFTDLFIHLEEFYINALHLLLFVPHEINTLYSGYEYDQDDYARSYVEYDMAGAAPSYYERASYGYDQNDNLEFGLEAYIRIIGNDM